MNVFPEEQSDFYKLFSENSNNLLIYLDSDENILAINKAARDKVYYIDEQDAIGRKFSDVFAIDRSTSVVIESLNSGQEVHGLERLVNIKGNLVYLIIDTKIIFTGNGLIQGLVCILRDITDRKIEEQKLVTLEKQAVSGLLAAGIAHEIRNPLTAAIGFIQLLQQNSIDEQKQKQYLEYVLNELKSISKLVSDFMRLSTPTETNKQKISITQLLNETIDFMQGQAILSNVVIERCIFCENIMATVDSDQLKQVFINFIRNAIEASNKDNATILISLDQLDKAVTITIEDNGIGISAENIGKIYDPFFTTKKEGTGIGLTGVSQIIRNHNGTINVDSIEGEGTKFVITLSSEE
ncbi:ATP-binding protein [Paenibacillus sediminis]|uniref:histidine kinase n=1 Tax=Paenibacillus sediminis TaxID=664909 RepID=A0ABS4H6D9_9BACL|nr:ATP-binding protein [Paenibacillus sediminis]MBP1938085.1 PAS domain S-box-containing protein [Paenibacillus sediminis]